MYLESKGLPRQTFYPLPRGFSQATRATFHIQLAERNLTIIAYLMIVSVIIIFSFNRIYVDDHSKRLAVSYLFGISFFKRYRLLWISLFVSYGLLYLFFGMVPTIATNIIRLNYSAALGSPIYNLANIYKLISLAFGLDVILSLLFIGRLERGVIRVLKGGEL